MLFKLYRDVKVFYQDICDVLIRHEAQNLIMLGNVIIGNDGWDKIGWRDPANWFMATVSDNSGIKLTALMTPPHNLTLYATDNQYDDEVLECLIDGLSKTDFAVGGVMTENKLAEDFARVYAASNGIKFNVNMRQRIYELVKVNPNISSVGRLRPARESDMSFLPYWIESFLSDETGDTGSLSLKNDAEYYRHHILSKKIFILEDNDTPVSMAQIDRELKTVCGVSGVYTPPYFRAKGYATSCVATVSRLVLDRGFAKCVLYTDLANPTSNSIYQKIGYNPICDSLDIKFI